MTFGTTAGVPGFSTFSLPIKLQQLLSKGIKATATLWPPLRRSYEQVHQAAQILAHQEQHTGAQVRERKADVGPLSEAIEHFCHITDNFAAGLFHCYDVEGLPRTNNDLEHCFGVARAHEQGWSQQKVAELGGTKDGFFQVQNSVIKRSIFKH